MSENPLTEVWCPACHTLYGSIMRMQLNETVWTHVKTPEDLPTRCTRCATVLERKPA